ncbi:nicotinamidase [Corallincola holothuriorum]|uniref:nicotinamidase n=1 Tax=Corallincola holothuriorum TaxID=2282215 RepID=A0A368NF67_9GAMM|nr:nicotinamidase [Corallincola holothuriorum]RCU48750.1 nicotinamidase [Corallincola holothuriorum]
MNKRNLIASIDVDPQKTFTPLCPNELPVPGGDEIGPALNAMASFADLRVVTKDAHSPSAPWVVKSHDEMLQPLAMPNADLTWVAHAVPGTVGFELLDELPALEAYDFHVYKGMEPEMHPYGACYHDLNDRMSTGLIEWLRCKQVTTTLVAGLALDYCVKTTAIQLKNAGFNVIVVIEACRGIADESIHAARLELEQAGVKICENVVELPSFLGDAVAPANG